MRARRLVAPLATSWRSVVGPLPPSTLRPSTQSGGLRLPALEVKLKPLSRLLRGALAPPQAQEAKTRRQAGPPLRRQWGGEIPISAGLFGDFGRGGSSENNPLESLLLQQGGPCLLAGSRGTQVVSSAGSQVGSPIHPSAFLSTQDPLNPHRARPCALGSGSTGHGLDDPDGDLLEEDVFEEAPAPGGAPDEPPSEEEVAAAPRDPEPHAEALAALTPGEGAVSFAEAARLRSAQRRAVAAQVAEARRSLRAGAKAIARSVSLEAPVVVVANSVALPGWAQDVHETHHPVLVGGVVACVRCSSIVATRATGTALARACPSLMQPGNASRLKRICQGKLPHQISAWPDGLAEQSEARPVAPLVRAQEA